MFILYTSSSHSTEFFFNRAITSADLLKLDIWERVGTSCVILKREWARKCISLKRFGTKYIFPIMSEYYHHIQMVQTMSFTNEYKIK